MVKLTRNIKLAFGLIAIIVLASGGLTGMRLLSINSYITGYEGAKARFYGVQYGATKKVSGDTVISWDPDGYASGLPSISGEETAVFIPSESVGKQPSTFGISGANIEAWLLKSTNIRNPIRTYEWTKSVDEETQAVYSMEEWQCKWFFSISGEPSGSEIPTAYFPEKLLGRNSVKDAKLWFQIDIAPMWYFENQTSAYFAIAELRVSDIQLGGKLKGEDYETTVNSEMRVTPMSAGSILPIYLGAFGEQRAESTAYNYQGKVLNPDLFRDSVWTYITLNDFGASSWWDYGHWWRGDVVTYGIDVHVFVIGEWKVQDVQDVPDDYGRSSKFGGTGLGASWFLSSMEGRLLLLLAGLAVGFILLAMFAPWVLIIIMQLFGGRRRR